ncbi:penicillin acylase family protein [Xanthomonas massiliensis]|uniref:penicillin acylase family protein n=1 Tax=Xanthomonas massiliensis TaxID=1720302 RepID=UPI000825B597|nr:penicillin acylase family protein [Xanthomonas massiliensis]
MPNASASRARRPRLLAAVALLLLSVGHAAYAKTTGASVDAAWQAQARRVTITRDEWGIAHVHGKSDADAVFGMVYAQAEDDFNRVETNYITNLGRLAEVEGEKAIWQDLRQRLYFDEASLKADYAASPDWLKQLMDAWAAGLNYFLATHPQVKPRLITRFEPWMTMCFTEGSIGGDIEYIPLTQLQAFYENRPIALAALERDASLREPSGSNGIAIAPQLTRDGHALLLINPHTSFFFRSELQMQSDEGLDAYGAVTWGQFFVYQGFNRRAGWMHTTSGVDRVDEFAETIVRGKDGTLAYRYGDELRPVRVRQVTLAYRQPDGSMGRRSFDTYATHHGPIIRAQDDGRWIAFAMMDRPVQALQQSFLRTKATDFAGFLDVARLQANSSNDTIYADADGTIAYLHPQFVPVRNPKLDYRRPVDGSDPAADWHGIHTLDQLPQAIAPASGWVFNTNNWPWTAAGADSPRREDFPPYMDQAGENPRGPHAVRLLQGHRDFTLPGLMAAAYDSWQPAFADMVPALLADYEALPATDVRRARLAAPVALLRGWDYRWGLDSTAMTLAQFWGDALWPQIAAAAQAADVPVWRYAAGTATSQQRLDALQAAVDKLQQEFGSWQVAWAQVNRYQRNDGAIVQTFDDARPSLPVPFSSAKWGSLASFGARAYPGTRRLYGTSGNSFVAVVEFGPQGPVARAVSTGGESGDPSSPHFADQAQRYADGDLRPVHFTAEDVAAHARRTYRPGES